MSITCQLQLTISLALLVMVPSGGRGEAASAKKLEIPDAFTQAFSESIHHLQLDSGIPYVQRVPEMRSLGSI